MATFGHGQSGRGLRWAGQPLEQRALRVPIALPRPVELEVLVGHVGEDRRVVDDPTHPFEGEAVRRRLHDRAAVAGGDHRAERGLQFGGVRGGRVLDVVLLLSADPRRHRAHEAGRETDGLERRDGQVRGRRLAVRAGDAEHAELPARVVVPPRRGRCQCRLRGSHDELGHVEVERPFQQERGRPGTDRRLREVVPVDVRPRDRDEQPAGDHPARVVGDATDRDRGERRRADRLAPEPRAAQPALRGQPFDEPAERLRAPGFGGPDAVLDRGHRRPRIARRSRPAASPARYVHGRSTISWAGADSTHSAPNEALCSHSP